MKPTRVLLLLLLSFPWVVGCSTPDVQVKCWGEMRDVLREGNTQGRVNLSRVVHRGTWGVGALEGLEGEITVLDGEASLAVVREGKLVHRPVSHRDAATLLILAEVQRWKAEPLIEVRTLKDLEFALDAAVGRSAFEGSDQPVPVRLEGQFSKLSVHVIDHSCPIANPDGPPPWRWSGVDAHGTIVGIFGRGLEGKWTHHGRTVHLHAVFETSDGERYSGHVDDLALGEGVRLFLPTGSPVSK